MRVGDLSEVAHHVAQRLARLQAGFSDREVIPALLPLDRQFRVLIEEAFWASISTDEGRACRFTLAYYGRGPTPSNDDVAVCLARKPYSRSVLRRLAAVAHAADAEIAVELFDDGLRIVGLCKRLRPSTDSRSSTAPRPIEIEARGPGHLFVRYLIWRILTYADGQILEPNPNVLDVKGPFRSALDALADRSQIRSRDLRFDLKSLLALVDRHAHGGLVVLSADEPMGLESKSWTITNDVYSPSDAWLLHSDSFRRTQLPKDDPERISFHYASELQQESHRLRADTLMLSAALSLTDGGLWLDGNLRPRAFGVFTTLDPVIRISLAEDAAANRLSKMEFDTLGARHRALVAVAGNNPGCPAIAVSVDGGFAAALKDASREEVLVWKFQSWDWGAEDPFDPQSQAIWSEFFEAAESDSKHNRAGRR